MTTREPSGPEERLEALLRLREDDPRRAEWLADPELRALHDNYRAFLADDGADLPGMARADAALTAWREQEIEAAPVRTAARIPVAERRPWWHALFAPALRPAWGMAVVLGVAAAWFAMRPEAPQAPVLRGDPTATLRLLDARAVAGGVELAWHAEPGADAYEVVFSDASLAELATRPAGADTTLTVAAADLPTGRGGVWYRVVARAQGDAIARSAFAEVPGAR